MDLAKLNGNALLASVVDTKLTRSELLDLMVGQVDAELLANLNKLKQEREALSNIPVKDVLPLLKEHGTVKLGAWKHYGVSRATDVSIDVDMRIHRDLLPPKLAALLDRREELGKAIGKAEAQRNKLIYGKRDARLEMLRQSLATTPEGAKVLDAISSFKDSVKARLLGSGEK